MLPEDDISEISTGQIIRVYAPDRYTIWRLDTESAISCYDVISAVPPRVGDLVSFRLSFDGRRAISPCEVDQSELSSEQRARLVVAVSSPLGGPPQSIRSAKA